MSFNFLFEFFCRSNVPFLGFECGRPEVTALYYKMSMSLHHSNKNHFRGQSYKTQFPRFKNLHTHRPGSSKVEHFNVCFKVFFTLLQCLSMTLLSAFKKSSYVLGILLKKDKTYVAVIV
jgi:hypothetical protein